MVYFLGWSRGDAAKAANVRKVVSGLKGGYWCVIGGPSWGCGKPRRRRRRRMRLFWAVARVQAIPHSHYLQHSDSKEIQHPMTIGIENPPKAHRWCTLPIQQRGMQMLRNSRYPSESLLEVIVRMQGGYHRKCSSLHYRCNLNKISSVGQVLRVPFDHHRQVLPLDHGFLPRVIEARRDGGWC